jgi:hypothetical protein
MILLTYLGVSSNDITADICDIIQSETKKKEILHLYPDKKNTNMTRIFYDKKKKARLILPFY